MVLVAVSFVFGFALVLLGLVVLVRTIPVSALNAKERDVTVRTEFFSARAAYWCVISGLIVILITSIGSAAVAVIAQF